MFLSEGIEIASEEAPEEVDKKIRAVGRLAIAFFGDVPVATLVFERIFEFLEFVWNMPKGWVKSHGRNRHGQAGREIDPNAELREAHEQVAPVATEVMAAADLSAPEKRRRVVEHLTPRLTDEYLLTQWDMSTRIARTALGSAVVGRPRMKTGASPRTGRSKRGWSCGTGTRPRRAACRPGSPARSAAGLGRWSMS